MNVTLDRDLIHLVEECSELQKAVSKIARFGWTEQNRMNLIEEMADVHLMITKACDNPSIPVTTGDVVKMLPVKQRRQDAVLAREEELHAKRTVE